MSSMEYVMTGAHVAVKVASLFPLAAQAADMAERILNQVDQANYNQKYLKAFSERIHRHQESLKKCNPDSFKEETYKHYVEVLNEICSYINEMKKPGKFSQRAIWRMKKFLKAGDIADMHKELNTKLDEAMADFQLSEIMTISETLNNMQDTQKKEQDALAQIALTLKGFAPNIPKEYLLKPEDFEDEDDDDDDDPPVIRGAVRRRAIGSQLVAVKAMGQPSEKDQATLNKRVAILTALTTCENIERFVGTMSSAGTLYIATGWAEKGDLQTILQTESFPWDVKIKWASEIANAVKFCHAAEILHHDLKAKNVLIDQAYSVKLSNFESSRFETDATTSLKGRMSSIRWTAPEKLKTSYVPYTKKCDIYSFGIVLWEITTGKKPFYQTENDTAVASLILDKNERPTPIPDDTPDEYKELVQTCWAAKSIDRSSISIVLHKLLKLRKKYTKSDNFHRMASSGSTISLNDTKTSTSLPEIFSEPEPEPATPESVTMTLENENVSVQVGESNLPEKTWDQVLQLHKEHKYNEAFPYFEKLAKEKNNEAVFYVGYYLYEGRGTKKDETEALTYLGQAADANIARAQFMYAFALLKGSTYDAQHGIDNLKKAVNAGFPQAFEFYGDILFNGEHGLPLNTEAAEKYYKMAVDKAMNSAKPKYDQAQKFNKTLAARRAAEKK